MPQPTLLQGKQVLDLISQSNISEEKLKELLESGSLAQLLNGDSAPTILQETDDPMIQRLPGIFLPEKSVPLKERIAAGEYESVIDEISEQIKSLTLSANPRNLALLHFDERTTIRRVRPWLREYNYEPALIEDLLAVGAHTKYRNLQKNFPIIVLEPVLRLSHFNLGVPCLHVGKRGSRILTSYRYAASFAKYCRFLVVCK